MSSCGGLILLLLLAVLAGRAHSRYSSYEHEYIRTILTVRGNPGSYKADGAIAVYSNASFSQVSGLLYGTDGDFGCPRAEPVTNGTVPPPSLVKPFVLFVPLTTSCGDYAKAVAAQRLGAVGVIFYTSDSSRRLSRTTHTALRVAVTRVFVRESDRLTEQLTQGSSQPFRLVQVNGGPVTASLEHITVVYRSQTFYFVVFAFSLLIVLSLTWFIVTYTKRLFERCSRRKRRVGVIFTH